MGKIRFLKKTFGVRKQTNGPVGEDDDIWGTICYDHAKAVNYNVFLKRILLWTAQIKGRIMDSTDKQYDKNGMNAQTSGDKTVTEVMSEVLYDSEIEVFGGSLKKFFEAIKSFSRIGRSGTCSRRIYG